MKTPDYKHISIREERRPGRLPRYIVTWTPAPGDRHRSSFESEQAAIAAANQIENSLRKGASTFSPREQREIAAALVLRDQFFPNMGILDLVKAAIKFNETKMKGQMVILADAGGAFIESRSNALKFKPRTTQTVRSHMTRFIKNFGARTLPSINHTDIEHYLEKTIGGCGRTQNQNLITIRSFFRWAQLKKQWLPFGSPTQAELVEPPIITKQPHQVYTPDEFIRGLIVAPTRMLMFLLLGQFAGIRSEERLRLVWEDWRADEDNKLVLESHVTKTKRRRRVDVLPNLSEWLFALRGAPQENMVAERNPFRYYRPIFRSAGVKDKGGNCLRAGYASYHLELFDNPALTAKNDGHSVSVLETEYKSIRGVTKEAARQMFDITPQRVIEFARLNKLPEPEWADKFPTVRAA